MKEYFNAEELCKDMKAKKIKKGETIFLNEVGNNQTKISEQELVVIIDTKG